MIVSELIKILKECQPEMKVVTQSDEEGNGYHNTYTVGVAVDDVDNGYPDVNDKKNLEDIYGEDIPEGRVVVIV